MRRRQFLFQLMGLVRRLRDVLALRRIPEATFLRDSDKVPELMNLHRVILSCERRFVEAGRRPRTRVIIATTAVWSLRDCSGGL